MAREGGAGRVCGSHRALAAWTAAKGRCGVVLHSDGPCGLELGSSPAAADAAPCSPVLGRGSWLPAPPSIDPLAGTARRRPASTDAAAAAASAFLPSVLLQ